MSYRNGNYAAFYVAEPFIESNLGANAAPDFCYYRTLCMWKGQDYSFPFIDSHEKNYNVRDGSSWERTLKPRLHERMRNSKNMILFLSSSTRESRALKEEIEHGIGALGLPVIAVYPGLEPIDVLGHITFDARRLWESVPAFKRLMNEVPTLHIPMKKEALEKALQDTDFMVRTKRSPGCYRL